MDTTNIDKYLALNPDETPQDVAELISDENLHGRAFLKLKRLGLQDNILISSPGAPIQFHVFLKWMECGMIHGSQMKVMICEPHSYSALANVANVRTYGFAIREDIENNASKKIGLGIAHLRTPFGPLDLVMCNLNSQIGTKSSTGNMVMIDLGSADVISTAVAIGVFKIVA